MIARAEVQVLERGMAAPHGVRFTATSLIIDGADEATFIEAGAWLQRIEGCRAWWWGDYMRAYCEWKLAQDTQGGRVETDEEAKEKARVTYTAQYAEAAGVSIDTLQNWKGVASFFPAPSRQGGLSWSHHYEASVGISTAPGALPLAMQWLARAQQEGWGKTELRAAIRSARIAATTTQEPMPPTRMQEIYAFTRWARSHLSLVDRITKAEAATLRAELEPVAKLLSALDARLGPQSRK